MPRRGGAPRSTGASRSCGPIGFVRTMGIPARAAEWYGAMSPVTRAHLAAFAAGVSLYASVHPDQIADSLKVVLPTAPRRGVAAARLAARPRRRPHAMTRRRTPRSPSTPRLRRVNTPKLNAFG